MLVLWALVWVLGSTTAASDVVVAVNTFKWLRFTSDKFLGLSVAPTLLHSSSNYSAATITLLQGLAPAYLRVGGGEPRDVNSEFSNITSANSALTKAQWRSLYQLATDSGLRLVFSLNLCLEDEDRGSNYSSGSSNTYDSLSQLLSDSDQQGFDPVWQYRYVTEPQVENDTASKRGKELGREVIVLRNILDKYTRYQRTAVVGPDFVINDKATSLQYLKDFLQESDAVVSVLVLQMESQMKANLEDGVFKSLSVPVLALSKMLRMPSTPGQLNKLSKKQLWIAESDSEGYSGQFLDAMTWAMKLGHAGRLGYDVVLRRPTELNQPTPDYWVSLLYRNLVGSAVLATRLMTGHASVTVFASCVAYYDRAARSVLNTATEYDRGAVVVWGVNSGSESALVTLLTVRQEYVHLYALTADPETHSRRTLMNGKRLVMTHGYLQKLSPLVQPTSLNMTVPVPAQSVFFIVLPRAVARACLSTAALMRSDELLNPQWKKTQSANSKELLNNDSVFEKGGTFTNPENVDVKSDAAKNELLSSKNISSKIEDKSEEKVNPKEQFNIDNIISFKKKSTNISEKDSLGDVNKIKSSENSTDKILLKTKDLNDLNKKVLMENVTILPVITSESQTTGIPEESTNYKRFHNLQRNNSNPMAKFMTLDSLKHLVEANNTEFEKPNHKISLNLEEIKEKSNDAIKLLKSNKEGNEDFDYRPGTFYETLGSLKIDSNLSLADLEEQNDALAVMLKETEKCGECNSTLQVTERTPNLEETDRNIIESTTQYLEEYLKTTQEVQKLLNARKSNGSNRLCSSHDIIEEETLDQPKNSTASVYHPTDQASIDNTNQYKTPENSFTIKINHDSSTKNTHEKKTLERNKRDIQPFKYISQIFNKNFLEEQTGNSTKNTSQMEEIQLSKFLQELTEEGEDILKYFDDKNQIQNQNRSYQEKNEVSFSVIPLGFNKSITKPENEESVEEVDPMTKFYIRNNLITNHTTKPKRNFNSTMSFQSPKNLKTVLSRPAMLKSSPTITKNDNFQPPENKSKLVQAEEFLSTVTVKVNDFSNASKTQGNNTFNWTLTFPEEMPAKKQSVLNSTGSKSYQHFTSYPYERSSLNQGESFEQINNQETTTTLENTLKPFQEEIMMLPTTYSPLKINKLNAENLADSNTESNLYLQITLPEKNLLKAQESVVDVPNSKVQYQILDEYHSLKTNKDPNFEEIHNQETKIASYKINKHLEEGLKLLPTMQQFSKRSDAHDTDVKGTKLTDTPFGTSKDVRMDFETSNPNSGSNKKDTTSDQVNFKTQQDTKENVLPLNKAMHFPNAQNVFNNLKKPVISRSNSNTNSPFDDTLLKPIERIELFKTKMKEAFEARLEKARERLRQLTPISSAPILLRDRLSNNPGDNLFSYKKTNHDGDVTEISKQSNQQNLVAAENQESVKKQLHSEESPLSLEYNLESRSKRQIFSNDDEQKSVELFNQTDYSQPDAPGEKLINYQSIPEIVIESTYTPVHKWIIPLSDHAERIVLKNKIFPVKLYGILSDDWKKQNDTKNVGMKNVERKRRSVQYSCMRDHFDDYSGESDGDGVKVEKEIKQMDAPVESHPSLLSNDNLAEVTPILLIQPEDNIS